MTQDDHSRTPPMLASSLTQRLLAGGLLVAVLWLLVAWSL
jgi:hypothetical protein